MMQAADFWDLDHLASAIRLASEQLAAALKQ